MIQPENSVLDLHSMVSTNNTHFEDSIKPSSQTTKPGLEMDLNLIRPLILACLSARVKWFVAGLSAILFRYYHATFFVSVS